MSNYSNIKPYADMVHTAAQYGGPTSYIDKLATANYRAGYLQGSAKCFACSAVAGVVSIVVWEGLKYLFRTAKDNHEQKVKEALREAREAHEECLREFNRTE